MTATPDMIRITLQDVRASFHNISEPKTIFWIWADESSADSLPGTLVAAAPASGRDAGSGKAVSVLQAVRYR